ncbi:MAG TPA: hypothetical protein VEH48_02570 [Candidatus Nitrosopolaris sp.]|nr:hypothetical protein [Candidatus Nitrosopolaris sp.]
MVQTVESQSEKQSEDQSLLLRQLLLPSAGQVALDLLVAILLLLLFNIRPLWHYLNFTVLGLNQSDSGGVFAQAPGWLQAPLKAATTGRLPQIAFWAFAGTGLYLVAWFAKNAVINIYNDIVASRFTRPLTYRAEQFWSSVLMQKLFFGGGLAVLAGYGYMLVRLLGVLSQTCHSALANFSLLDGSLKVTTSIIGLAVLLRVFMILLHVVIRSWSNINQGL